MKRLYLILSLFVLALPAISDDMILQIWQSDGNVVSINLNEQPVTTYSEGNLTITTTKTIITYPLEKVVKYTYVSAEGIDSLEGMKSHFSQDGETLIFSGLPLGTEIAIYSSAGMVMQKVKAVNQHKTTVSVSDLPPGVYLVKVNEITYKITKR